VLYFQRHNAVEFVESQPTFRRNILPPSSGSNKQNKTLALKQVASRVIGWSQSHIAADGQSVCLGVEPHLGLMTRYLFGTVGRPLWREEGSVYCQYILNVYNFTCSCLLSSQRRLAMPFTLNATTLRGPWIVVASLLHWVWDYFCLLWCSMTELCHNLLHCSCDSGHSGSPVGIVRCCGLLRGAVATDLPGIT
jgi:hypothetical protein